MYNTYQEVLQGFVDSMAGADQDKYQETANLIYVHEAASEEARQLGYVGVGVITYAENALKLAQSADYGHTGGSEELERNT